VVEMPLQVNSNGEDLLSLIAYFTMTGSISELDLCTVIINILINNELVG
jgi:hypothetical protein